MSGASESLLESLSSEALSNSSELVDERRELIARVRWRAAAAADDEDDGDDDAVLEAELDEGLVRSRMRVSFCTVVKMICGGARDERLFDSSRCSCLADVTCVSS